MIIVDKRTTNILQLLGPSQITLIGAATVSALSTGAGAAIGDSSFN